MQRQGARTGQSHIDRKALASFLKRLQYPVGCLDFETFATAIAATSLQTNTGNA